MSAGLATSVVTPGMTAPEVSRTVPEIALCAQASNGVAATHPRASHAAIHH